MKPLKSFFMEEFRDFYRKEKRWLGLLPEVARSMPPAAVRLAVTEHLERTAARVDRLERIFRLMAETDQMETHSIRPFLLEADQVLMAVTISSVAIRRTVEEKKLELDIRTPGWQSHQLFPPLGQN